MESSFFYSRTCSNMAADIMHRFLCFVQRFLPFFTTLNFTDSLPETIIPLTKLPYGFRNRITQIIPAEIKNKFVKACAVIDRRGWDEHKQVFITDNHKLCRRAMNDSFLFRFCKWMDKFNYWRITKDGEYTIHPVWNSVLLVDEILDRKNDVYVNDTLILHCQPESYEKVIPTIIGHYTRLELHGKITWAQFKRLIHPGVKQIRVSGMIAVNSAEHDEFVDLIVRHCRGFEYSFSFSSRSKYNHEILRKLKNLLRNHKTHSVKCLTTDECHVVHKNRAAYYCYCGLVLQLPLYLITNVPLFMLLILFVPKSDRYSTPSTGEQMDLELLIISFYNVITVISLDCFIESLSFNTKDILSDNSEATDSLLPI